MASTSCVWLQLQNSNIRILMNPKFLSSIPVVVNAPHDDLQSGGITRRSFLKRSGGATVAALVALGLATETLHAQNSSNSSANASQTFDTYVQHAITASVTVTGFGNPGPTGQGDAARDAEVKLADALKTGGLSTKTTYNPITVNRPPIGCFKNFTAQGGPGSLVSGPPVYNAQTKKWSYTITVNATAIVSWKFQE